MTEDSIRQQLRTWIVNRAKDKPGRFGDDTPILESGILTSLDVVELIVFIEQLRGGQEVEVDSLDPESIRDVNAIYSRFFVAAAS
jgi:acyl carrier protein